MESALPGALFVCLGGLACLAARGRLKGGIIERIVREGSGAFGARVQMVQRVQRVVVGAYELIEGALL